MAFFLFVFCFVELKEGKNVEANLTSKSVSKVYLLFNNIIQEWRGPQPFPEVSLELSLGTFFLLCNQGVIRFVRNNETRRFRKFSNSQK